MKAQLKVLSGVDHGRIVVFSRDSIDIGRHPSSDLQLDPQRELEASARHATLLRHGGGWYVRDRESLNGTLVNGHTITADTKLDDTDQIRLGPEGPLLEFRLVPDSTPDGERAPAATAAPHREGAPLRPTAETTSLEAVDAQTAAAATEQRIQVEVLRRNRRLRTVTIVTFTGIVLAATAFVFENTRQRRLRDREVAALQARTDSMLRAANDAVATLQGQVEGLATALDRSHTQVERLQTDLSNAQRSGSSDREIQQLRRQLADASQALLYRQQAAYVDYGAIVEANQRAVAMIWADLGPNGIVTGTAFAVRRDGHMITSGHVIAGESGTLQPARLAVKFADSDQVYRARVVAIADDVDMAVVKVDIRGGVPTILGLNARPDTLEQGDPVAVIGFPLGTDLPMPRRGEQLVASTTFTAGSVSKVLSDIIQIDGYGAEGSSGSPVLDSRGEVVAVVFGGEAGSQGRIVLAVPATFVLRLISQLP